MHAIKPVRVLLATMLALAILGATTGSAAARRGSNPHRERNVRLAIRRAESQLDAVGLPPGSRPVRSLPNAAAQLLEAEPVGGGTVVRRRFWIVPRDPAAVYRWVENHGPGRFHRLKGDGEFDGSFFGEGQTPEPVREMPSLASPRPGGRGVLGSKLVLSALRLGQYRSAVRIEDLVIPVRPRPADERIPAAVSTIRLKIEHHPAPESAAGIEGEMPLVRSSDEGEVRSLTIGAPHRVAVIVALVDRLRVIQPPVGQIGNEFLIEEEWLEPGAPLPSTVHLLFESGHGRVLAEASQREGGNSERMRFAVGGEVMPALEGGVKVLRALIPERRHAVQTTPPDAQNPHF